MEENKTYAMVSFKRYEYPLGKITGSYTIKENVEPLGFKGEKLVETFQALVLVNN